MKQQKEMLFVVLRCCRMFILAQCDSPREGRGGEGREERKERGA